MVALSKHEAHSSFFFVCETNLAEFQLTALYLGICMKACLRILNQVATELHMRVGEIHVYSVSSICRGSGSEEFYMLVQPFTSVVGVVFSVALSRVINLKCLHLTAEN